MNNEITENIKRKLAVLEEKIKRLNTGKFLLFKKLSESSRKADIKINGGDYAGIQEEISYLNDWIEFYSKEIEKYESKLKKLDQNFGKGAPETKEIQESFKLIFKEAGDSWVKESIKKAVFSKTLQPIGKYAVPFFVLLLVIAGLFLLKPSITGHVVLGEETAYNDNLNLKINESGNYTWMLKQQGMLKSVAASGSVSGNGTARVYIEKDGSKYLVFDSKKLTNASATG